MAKEGLTEIVCIIDKSGSMACTADDAIGGFNTFLVKQRELGGEAKLTLILFDNVCKVIHEGEDLDSIVDLSSRNYVPGGGTALLDAVGLGIDKVVSRHAELEEEEKPERIIMVVVTDGGENGSKEYKRDVLLSKINDCRSNGWEFVFLGADESAFSEASSMGISKSAIRGYDASSRSGVTSMYMDMTSAVGSYRCSGKVDMDADMNEVIRTKDDAEDGKSDFDGLIV